ncbi:MAG: hypothetical protein WDW36_005773 [Sanguina aurantia]
MPQAALEVIIDSMRPINCVPGTDIIRQGDTGASEFYVLEEGGADVFVTIAPVLGSNGGAPKLKRVLIYGSGSAFGELALLYSAPRAATVRATQPCKLWVMERGMYNAVKRNFTHETFAARHTLLEQVPALRHLSSHHKAMLVDAMVAEEFRPNQTIFVRGQPGLKFYLIREGTAEVKQGTDILATLGPGQYFGERALLGADVRAADVVVGTKGPLSCYTLTQEVFSELLGSQEDIWRYERLKEVPILYALGERQLWQLAHSMREKRFKRGELVFSKGDTGDMFYIIQKGSFSVFDETGIELALLSDGSCFGELALLKQERRAASVAAVTDGEVLMLHRDQFTKLLGNLTDLRHVWQLEVLKKVPLLASLNALQRTALANALVSVNFAAGAAVITQGEAGDRFYIVEHGELTAFKDTPEAAAPAAAGARPKSISSPVMAYGTGSYFGELALLRNTPRAATVRCKSNVTLLALGRADFAKLLGPVVEAMQKEAEVYTRVGVWKGAKKVINIADTTAVAMLGAGGFGQVLLVKYQDQFTALKCISKAFVREQGLVEHVKREKDLMAECDHPFLVDLIGTTTDDFTLYMMMEAVMGGELFSYLQTRTRALDESHARFYAASVVLSLEYLHDRGLVYRDLKPENLLIDLKGYVKVTDFGFVKRVKKGTKTYTLCGTPEYLAPEIVLNKGHNNTADWWAVGVLIFELCNGQPPFMDEDRLAMFKKICTRDFIMPRHFSPALRNLVDRLLEPNPIFRIGGGREGAADIRNHAWFAGFDWEKFSARSMTAPYVPKQPKNGADTCNFKHMEPDASAFRNKAYKSTGDFTDF